jgi:NAD+ synthase (glutamine-hydrolysing)
MHVLSSIQRREILGMTGFIRVAAITPEIKLADPQANATTLLASTEKSYWQHASIAITSALTLTGATCGDFFLTHALQKQTQDALVHLCKNIPPTQLFVCGMPYFAQGHLYDCAVVMQGGSILGYVPRIKIPDNNPNLRCFSPSHTANFDRLPDGTPFGPDLRFMMGPVSVAITFGIPSDATTFHDAHLLLCLDATPEGVGKPQRRREQLKSLSLSSGCACVYVNAGLGESSTDGVYSGHRILTNEGHVCAEARWDDGYSLMDFSPSWVDARRIRTSVNLPATESLRLVRTPSLPAESDGTWAALRANPFLPADPAQIPERCAEILAIQVHALARRFHQIKAQRLVLGLSGGLDSTLALIVCAALCKKENLPAETVLAVTMPGFGTSDRTYNNACSLAKTLGAELREISIAPCVTQHFSDIGQDPETHDVTYENAQARARTWLLMDIANKEGGLLVGTGDLSEIALGWSTYNGDHMSMYSVNCSVPKTLIPHCLEAAATTFGLDESTATTLRATLKDICETPVSPELVPGVQHTESIVGRYELHDCFLWYFMRYGCDRKLLAELAALLHKDISEAERIRTLNIFCRRVITQQFKRSCSPDGPAIGGIALSPRGGWMLPSDANLTL